MAADAETQRTQAEGSERLRVLLHAPAGGGGGGQAEWISSPSGEEPSAPLFRIYEALLRTKVNMFQICVFMFKCEH